MKAKLTAASPWDKCVWCGHKRKHHTNLTLKEVERMFGNRLADVYTRMTIGCRGCPCHEFTEGSS